MGRRSIFVTVLFLEASVFGLAQAVIENPAKALATNAGRVVVAEEVLRIEGPGDGTPLKTVYDPVQVGPEGAIFVREEWNKVLQFDPQGRFVRSLVKIGKGPGEMEYVRDFLVTSDRVYVAGDPSKIFVYDHKGELLQEIGLAADVPRFHHILAADRDTILVQREVYPVQVLTEPQNCPEETLSIKGDGTSAQVVGSFPERGLLLASDDGMWWHTRFSFLKAAHFTEKEFFVSHTEEYLVKLFDAETGTVLRQFRRDYPRLKKKNPHPVTIPKGPTVAVPVYENDIRDLYVVGDRLWVRTSTVDPQKGALFDVFSPEGSYVDSFYLKFTDKDLDPWDNRWRFTFAEGFVYFSEKTGDDQCMIKKCRIRP